MRLDAVRGLFLVIMAGVHIASPVSDWLREPFGYTSAAEVFIFLSACLTGLVYGKTQLKHGPAAMRQRIWHRARLVYVVHLAVLLPMTLIAWVYAGQVIPFANHFHDFLLHPLGSLAMEPLLLHQPPLFDILPLYVLLLLGTPFAFALARQQGWRPLVTGSALIWLASQWHSLQLPPDSARLLPIRPGAFYLPAWQFLWVAGVALGETSLHQPLLSPDRRRVFGGVAAAVVLTGFIWRHGGLPAGLTSGVDLLTDKWTLGPLRLLNFTGWIVLLLAWNPQPPQWLLAPTALLGRHSLAVFAFHIPMAITATTIIQMFALSNVHQSLLVFGVMASLFLWAQWLKNNAHQRTQVATRLEHTLSPWHQRLKHREILQARPQKS